MLKKFQSYLSCHNIKGQLADKIPNNICEKEAIMSKTKKKLNDNVTEVTFLGGRVADIFSLGFGPLGACKRPFSLAQLAAEHYYRETVWTLTLQPAESWEKRLRSSASHQ